MNKETTEISYLLKEALDLWVDFSEVDPNQIDWKVSFGSGWSELDFRTAHNQIRESLEIDETGITACMLLRGYLENYQKNTEISLSDIVAQDATYLDNLRKFLKLTEIVNHPLLKEAVDDFKDFILEAAKHYGYDESKIAPAFDDRHNIGMSRFYALKATETLTSHQFSRGKYDDAKPMIYRGILKFPSIQMAINFLSTHEGSIIALALIRDEVHDCYSHFAFLIKNGENTFLLSDDENWTHPMQKKMSRRPDKHLAKKEFVDYLPYQLIDKFDDQQIDPDKNKATLLSKIKDLPIHQIVWITVLFEKLRQNFWNKKYYCKQISYFMEDISTLTTSIKQLNESKRDGSSLPVRINPAQLPKVINSEVSTESMKDEWAMKPTRKNEWLEKRYEHLVPDFAINPDMALLTESELKLLEDGEDKQSISIRFYNKQPKPLICKAIQGAINEEALSHCSDLKMMPSNNFGTMESLQKTQRWYARYNKASLINYYTHKEYEECKDEVMQWLRSETIKQKDRLIKIAVTEEFKSYHLNYVTFGSEIACDKKNILNINTGKRPIGSIFPKYQAIIGDLNYRKGQYYCPITKAVATIFAVFSPQVSRAIAELLNCEVKDLPSVLQNWRTSEQYHGNSILDYLDPMEWVVKDPWNNEFRFSIIIPFSKRGFNRIRKESGLPPMDFEKLKKDDD